MRAPQGNPGGPGADAATSVIGDALVEDGIPLAQFAVDDVDAEHQQLTARGVTFTRSPTVLSNEVIAVFDDTCGNLIMTLSEGPGATDRPQDGCETWPSVGRDRPGGSGPRRDDGPRHVVAAHRLRPMVWVA